MPAWLLSDWVLWVLTVLCGLAGFTLAIRGLIGDRARGRPTCWKCRYDLSASPGAATATAAASTTACPECGHVHKKRSQLFKTRRYWFRFLLGAALFMVALYCHTGPEVQWRRETGEKWWESIVPTTAWIVMLPKLSGDHITLLDRRLTPQVEINSRANMPANPGTLFFTPPGGMESPEVDPLPMLAGWQASLLVESCRVMIDAPTTKASDRERCIEWVVAARNKTDGAPPVLLKLLEDKEELVRYTARAALITSRMDRKEVAAIMIERLSLGGAPHVKGEAVATLAMLGPHAAAAVPHLVQIMREDPVNTAAAGDALIAIGEAAVVPFLAMMADPKDALHARAIDAIGRMGKPGSAGWPALLVCMKHGDRDAAAYALEATSRLNETIVPFLIATATDAKSPYRLQAVTALALIGPDADSAVPHLLPIALTGEGELAAAAAQAIDAIGLPDETVKNFSRENWINLLKALGSDQRMLRNFAWIVLVDQDAALPWIEIAINESLIQLDAGIIRLVMQFNEKAKHLSPMLVERMLREPGKFRSEIVDMLVLLGELHPQVLTRMIAALDDEDQTVRQIAEDVLAATPMDVERLLPVLMKRLELPSDSKRIVAMRLLGRMGKPASPALAALRKIAGGREGVESAAAGVAVEAIEDADGSKRLNDP